MAEIIRSLARDRDMVIIDSPPLNPVADAQILLDSPAIHAVLMVARAGKTTREAARRARAILERHHVEPLGLVVTGLRDSRRYGYESYYASPATNVSAPDTAPARALEARPEPASARRTRRVAAEQH
jgi:Mrp family chromosome partitioning ATPase